MFVSMDDALSSIVVVLSYVVALSYVVVDVQDFHSMPNSSIVDTTSSFNSTSSSPSMVNLPPSKVHVDENQRN